MPYELFLKEASNGYVIEDDEGIHLAMNLQELLEYVNGYYLEDDEKEGLAMKELQVVQELTHLANCNGLDIEANMPDFIIARYLMDSFNILMKANKANGEWFTLSAQEDAEKEGNQHLEDGVKDDK